MYVSGLATYAYKNCKAVDIASSIRVFQNSLTSYHPLLISVKNCANVSKSDIVGWLATMMSFLNDMKEGGNRPCALCLLILLGCSHPPEVKQDQLDSESLDPFPFEDVFRFVCVPENDVFGVSEAIGRLGTSSEKCEIYSSHGLLAIEEDTDALLRKDTKNQQYLEHLFGSLSGAPK